MDIAYYYGLAPTVTSTYRTWENQQRLYDRFLRGESAFPANRPGDSAHNFGWAFDSVVPEHQQGLWDQIRSYVGFEVLPNDIIHAQVPNWRRLRDSGFQRLV